MSGRRRIRAVGRFLVDSVTVPLWLCGVTWGWSRLRSISLLPASRDEAGVAAAGQVLQDPYLVREILSHVEDEDHLDYCSLVCSTWRKVALENLAVLAERSGYPPRVVEIAKMMRRATRPPPLWKRMTALIALFVILACSLCLLESPWVALLHLYPVFGRGAVRHHFASNCSMTSPLVGSLHFVLLLSRILIVGQQSLAEPIGLVCILAFVVATSRSKIFLGSDNHMRTLAEVFFLFGLQSVRTSRHLVCRLISLTFRTICVVVSGWSWWDGLLNALGASWLGVRKRFFLYLVSHAELEVTSFFDSVLTLSFCGQCFREDPKLLGCGTRFLLLYSLMPGIVFLAAD